MGTQARRLAESCRITFTLPGDDDVQPSGSITLCVLDTCLIRSALGFERWKENRFRRTKSYYRFRLWIIHRATKIKLQLKTLCTKPVNARILCSLVQVCQDHYLTFYCHLASVPCPTSCVDYDEHISPSVHGPSRSTLP
jgi:hypothetical protein